ncbi:hypothetical protein CEXT_520621, partial [Caerostris extrusa]
EIGTTQFRREPRKCVITRGSRPQLQLNQRRILAQLTVLTRWLILPRGESHLLPYGCEYLGYLPLNGLLSNETLMEEDQDFN